MHIVRVMIDDNRTRDFMEIFKEAETAITNIIAL